MKRFQWTVAILLVVVAQCAFADSISTFRITVATISVSQFDLVGDNLFLVFTGPGTHMTEGGVILCLDWCGADDIFAPGSKSPVVLSLDAIFLSGLDDGKLGGQDFFSDTSTMGPILLSSSGGALFR